MIEEAAALSEEGLPFAPKIYINLDPTIRFILPTAEGAIKGAKKAITALYTPTGFQDKIDAVNPNKVRDHVNIVWDFNGSPLSVDIADLNPKAKPGQKKWLLEISRDQFSHIYWRRKVKEEVGLNPLISEATVELEFPDKTQADEYRQSIGFELNASDMNRIAQVKAYNQIGLKLRKFIEANNYERFEDLGQVLIDSARSMPPELQAEVIKAVSTELPGIYRPVIFGFLEKVIGKKPDPFKDFEKALTKWKKWAEETPDKKRAYCDALYRCQEKAYKFLKGHDEARSLLYDELYKKYEARLKEKGVSADKVIKIGPFEIAALQKNVVDCDFFNANVSTHIQGEFDLVKKEFTLDKDFYPKEFSLDIYLSEKYRYSDDKQIQTLIYCAAGLLSGKTPDYFFESLDLSKDESYPPALEALKTIPYFANNPRVTFPLTDLSSLASIAK